MDLILYSLIKMIKEAGYSCETLEDLRSDLQNGFVGERDGAFIAWGWLKGRLDCDMIDFEDADPFIQRIDRLKKGLTND